MVKFEPEQVRDYIIILAFLVLSVILLPAHLIYPSTKGSISGRVVDFTTGGGLAGAYVTCTPWGYKTQSDTNGNYSLTNLPAETYTLAASRSGYHYTVIEGISVTVSGTNQHREDIAISMVPAANPSPDGFESDNTSDEAKEIWVDASISFLPPQVHNFHQSGDEDWVKFYAHGTIANPVPYTIRTSNLGFRCDTVITLYDQNKTLIRGPIDDYWEGEPEELSWNCPAEGYYYVRISPGTSTVFGENTYYELSVFIPTGGQGILSGTVMNGLNNRPITGAKVSTDTGGVALSIEGLYVMPSPAGVCGVTASADNFFETSENNIAVNDGEAATVDFSLSPSSIPNISKVETNLQGPPAPNSSISITIHPLGGSSGLSYQFWRATQYGTPNVGNWSIVQEYSADNSCSWSPLAEGNYVLVAWVTNDPTSGTFHQAGLTIETAGNRANPVQITSFTASDLGSPHPVGSSFSLTTEAFGGTGVLSYKYWRRQGLGGSWTPIREYSTDEACVWTPTQAGVYTLIVWVTDDTTQQYPPQAGVTCIVHQQ